ncbi:hypothetical protein [Amycolatopsis kentuckyensis]|uniref:hypothetical protein n=1 Tax=Amycolatopsis kentuckyensis TaxID=218823 RepID=UPI00356336DB
MSLRRIGGDATWFALRPRFDELVAATRAGQDTLSGWHALEAEIDRLIAAELDQTIRNGDFAEEIPPGPVASHRCPRDLCDRVVRAAPDQPPTCQLWGIPMPGQAEWPS